MPLHILLGFGFPLLENASSRPPPCVLSARRKASGLGWGLGSGLGWGQQSGGCLCGRVGAEVRAGRPCG